MPWNFLDYVDPGGQNAIKLWLDSLPTKVKARINTRLQHLAGLDVLSDTRYTEKLSGKYSNLIEIKIEANNVQYRPLAFYGPERWQITILFPAEERSDRFEPPGACDTALRRRIEVQAEPEKRTCAHDYS